MKGLRHLQAIMLSLLLGVRLSGTVVFQPTFGHPLICTDRIVFTSVDGKTLIGIDKEGGQKWKIQFPGRISLNAWDEEFVLVQSGEDVFQIDVRQGAQSKLVRMPKFEYLSADEDDHSFLVALTLGSITIASRCLIRPITNRSGNLRQLSASFESRLPWLLPLRRSVYSRGAARIK